MILLVAVFASCAVVALGGWAWTLVSMTRSLLPNAQAYQALSKINDMEDEKLRAILANFEKRADRMGPAAVDQLAAMRKKAQQFGVDIAPQPPPPNRPVPPAPDPIDTNDLLREMGMVE